MKNSSGAHSRETERLRVPAANPPHAGRFAGASRRQRAAAPPAEIGHLGVERYFENSCHSYNS